MNKTKKQKLERLLTKAVSQDNDNRVRDVVRLMTNEAEKYGPIGNLYLKKLMKDDNKYVAGAASSAYMLRTGDIRPVNDLEKGGLGYVDYELKRKIVKRFDEGVGWPFEIGGKIFCINKNDQNDQNYAKIIYDWETGEKVKEFSFPVHKPFKIKDKNFFCDYNRTTFYDWETGEKVKDFTQAVFIPFEANGKYFCESTREGNIYDWETGKQVKDFPLNLRRRIRESPEIMHGLFKWRGTSLFGEKFDKNKIFYEVSMNKRLKINLEKLKRDKTK